jgi:hypothetical protein
MHNWRANLQQLDEKSTHWANKIKQKNSRPRTDRLLSITQSLKRVINYAF